MQEGRLPQLRMRISLGAPLASSEGPDGYRIVGLEDGRLEDWIAVLNSTGDLGEWTIERAVQATASGSKSQVLPDAIAMAYSGAAPAATACLTVHQDTADAEMGWVAVHPDHRRRGLGRAVCTAVLQSMQRRGYAGAFLFTDDFRLAAISLYWSMGFRPELTHDSHGERWERLRELLALPA